MLTQTSRAVSTEEIETFWRDGVVVLRGILPADWLGALAPAIERTITDGGTADLGSLVEGSSGAGPAAPAFVAGVDHWRHDEMFRSFALDSPLGPIAAQLLGGATVRLWEDSVLVKEAGSPFETRFHTDASYFQVCGDQQCTVWVPLDAASPASGMVRWVRGSHLDPVEYRPNLFVTDDPITGTMGEPVPDVLVTPDLASRLITFDVGPGDITVHHARTLHGAPANTSASRRRALSVRYCGDDVRYRHKPGLPSRPERAEVTDGDRLTDPWCPQAWPRRPPPAHRSRDLRL